MSKSAAISPSGRLWLEDDPDLLTPLPPDRERRLVDAFETSSEAGLLALVSDDWAAELPPALSFWREFARRLFENLRQLGESSEVRWRELPVPADDDFQHWVANAPPMRGLEYLSVSVLRSLWNALHDFVLRRAADFAGDYEAFLQSVNPLWHLLGRITFHLAENKRDANRPFAFLATYTSRVSAKARLQHLPLADAVKKSAEAGNRDQLSALLEPVRRAAEQCELVRELLSSRALFQPQTWSIRQAYRFLSEADGMRAAGVVLRLPDWWNSRQRPRPQVQVRIGQQAASGGSAEGMLDFDVQLALDGQPLTDKERRQLLAADEGLALLRGKWVEVDGQRLREALDHWQRLQDEHPDGISFIQGMRLLAGAALDGPAQAAELTADWSQVTSGDWLRTTLERLRDPSAVHGCVPGRDLSATLRPYQADGVRWLWFMTELKLGACLADDMGLGKTIQVIDLLLQLRREDQRRQGPQRASSRGSARPSLLVVPASLVGNWRQEFERFAPTLRIFYAHPSECDADSLARMAREPATELASFDAVVTTYTVARSQPWLTEVQWRLVVLDEAQAIKNASAAQTRAVKKLATEGRIALTGTPIENHLGDLWSIFDFCCPGLLGSASQFKNYMKRTGQMSDGEGFGALRRLVRPYILRRLKSDPAIAPDLPDKTEMRTDCGLSKRQAVLYQKAVDDLARRLKSAEGMARRGLVLSVLMQLKQICNHPSQFLGDGSFAPGDSGKFQRLAEICDPIAQRQERMLVFTQFQALTEPLAQYLESVFGRAGLVLHGGTPVAKRKELVRAFQSEQGPPYFVISLKAGGSGLNLTAASHVVHFDRWWNPAVENQATDRAFRIGQTRNVLVHKFVCRGTLEERIDQTLRGKQQLSDEILRQDGEMLLTEMSDRQLLDFVALDLNRAAAEV